MSDPRHPFLISHGLSDYPFPLSDGRFASLTLPAQLTHEDADRLCQFVQLLSVPERSDPGHVHLSPQVPRPEGEERGNASGTESSPARRRNSAEPA
jgi:hypothetical protein